MKHNHLVIQIVEKTPSDKEFNYECRGLVDALCKFGSGVRDDDHEAFVNAGYALQADQNLTAEKIAEVFNRFTENIVNVYFINE